MHSSRNTRIRKLLTWSLLLAATALAYPTWRHLSPVSASDGWKYHVFASNLPKVSALEQSDSGGIFASLEYPNERGGIVLLTPSGRIERTIEHLSKPDGLTTYRGGLVVAQEGGIRPVLLVSEHQTKTLFEADSVEGIATNDRELFAIEDKPQGRLLAYNIEKQQLRVLRDGLDEGEGITACADGRLFYTEKGKGRVRQWLPTGNDKTVASGLNAPGFVQCTDDGLWITEDITHGARLLWLGFDGQLRTILSHLRAAQTIIDIGDGHLLLAEQGRDRVLELYRSSEE